MRTLLLTLVALCAFAGNSLLCRMALLGPTIDPASFTAIRLGAGAITLAAIAAVTRSRAATRADRAALAGVRGASSLASGLWLSVYAFAFAWAYLALGAGTGALILFGAVQLTMIAAACVRGERPTRVQAGGIALAFAGLVYLVAPRLAAPPPEPALAMLVAGIAWGIYTLRARGLADPLAATAANFVAALPFALVALLAGCVLGSIEVDAAGVWLAVASGAVTSGLGYVVWYAALRGLGATQAAVVQLAVPVLAALGGVAWLGERVSGQLAGAGIVILAGIAVVLVATPRA